MRRARRDKEIVQVLRPLDAAEIEEFLNNILDHLSEASAELDTLTDGEYVLAEGGGVENRKINVGPAVSQMLGRAQSALDRTFDAIYAIESAVEKAEAEA